MCDYDSEGGERVMIDQSLFEAARRIECRLAGAPASDAAWKIFFGRSGGAVVWTHYQRMKSSYAQAAATTRLATAFKRTKPLGLPQCEPADAPIL
jgi:hypothetical protein